MKLSNDTVVIRLSGAKWQAMGEPETTSPTGQPIHRFRKELIRVGKYLVAGQSFEVDQNSIQNFEKQFAAMQKNGVRVYVPEGHTNDPSKNRGWVDKMFVEGESLIAEMSLVGEAKNLVDTNDVSIFALGSWSDGKGNKYSWPILHVAITPAPRIPGMRKFEKIQLADSSLEAVVCEYEVTQKGVGAMEKFKQMAVQAGIKIEGMTDDQIVEAIFKALADAKGATPAPSPKPAAPTPLVKIAASDDAEDEEDDLPSPALIRLSAKDRTNQINDLLRGGQITKKVATGLAKTWIGEDNKALIASMDEEGNQRFEETMAALKENAQVVRVGQLRKGIALSRDEEGSDSDTVGSTEPDEKVVSSMLSRMRTHKPATKA